MYDYHVHSDFSKDARMSMDSACRQAVKIGLCEMAFTEHVDKYYPDRGYVWDFDVPLYFEQLDQMKKKWGSKLALISAVEVGLHEKTLKDSREFTDRHPFEFILGSLHIIGDTDLHNGDYFRDKGDQDAVDTYYLTINRCVRAYPHFNVLGHLDLIRRYAHYLHDPGNVRWEKDDDLVEDTLKTLIASERGIEVNLSGYRDGGIQSPMPEMRIIKRYRELGGEIITLGSDAHTERYIGRKFDLGLHLLQEAGFRYLTTFRHRQPSFVPISKVKAPLQAD
jgi:histidinol-phosphatase (PHP family)